MIHVPEMGVAMVMMARALLGVNARIMEMPLTMVIAVSSERSHC